jgi:hypothetical protein
MQETGGKNMNPLIITQLAMEKEFEIRREMERLARVRSMRERYPQENPQQEHAGNGIIAWLRRVTA